MAFTSYYVENDRDFQEALRRAASKVSDLRIPLKLIAQDWFDSNAAIFLLSSGPGQYPDLSEKYKKAKQRDWGFVYPILRAGGKTKGKRYSLEDSITNINDPNAIANFQGKQAIELGTSVPYGVYHQYGTNKMPMRKFLFIGPESQFNSKGRVAGRLERWTSILADFVIQKTGEEVGK